MCKRNTFINRLSSFVGLTRSASTTHLSKVDLFMRMKSLNDKKRYDKALNLFYENRCSVTDLSLNQALKACSNQRKLDRGRLIHDQLSPSSLGNSFIRCSLMNLYSRSSWVKHHEISKINPFQWNVLIRSTLKNYSTKRKWKRVRCSLSCWKVDTREKHWSIIDPVASRIRDEQFTREKRRTFWANVDQTNWRCSHFLVQRLCSTGQHGCSSDWTTSILSSRAQAFEQRVCFTFCSGHVHQMRRYRQCRKRFRQENRQKHHRLQCDDERFQPDWQSVENVVTLPKDGSSISQSWLCYLHVGY